jgi:hypothetical protein
MKNRVIYLNSSTYGRLRRDKAERTLTNIALIAGVLLLWFCVWAAALVRG